jgi:hypothetical protein
MSIWSICFWVVSSLTLFTLGFFSGAMFGLSSERSRQEWRDNQRRKWIQSLVDYGRQTRNN